MSNRNSRLRIRRLLFSFLAVGKRGRSFLGRETPDGDFGPATEKAVRGFQTLKDLDPDGKIGADTWTALLTG
ncbi:MAG: peptidoglycan-binding protein [Oscillospiraceae bacterium]|nr:peptidoglycan-binding protein [Oscillospiraceae bacterium]